jgi:hypothetical protein
VIETGSATLFPDNMGSRDAVVRKGDARQTGLARVPFE